MGVEGRSILSPETQPIIMLYTCRPSKPICWGQGLSILSYQTNQYILTATSRRKVTFEAVGPAYFHQGPMPLFYHVQELRRSLHERAKRASVRSWGTNPQILQYMRILKEVPCEVKKRPSVAQRPEHAFRSDKSGTNMHIQESTRVAMKLSCFSQGRSHREKRRHGHVFPREM